MKSVLVALVGLLFLATQGFAAEEITLKTPKDKASYSIGINIGRNMKQQSVEVNPDIVAKGLKDALSGAKVLLTDEEMAAAMTAVKEEVQAKQAEKTKQFAAKNKKEGDAFLAENKKKDGVKTLVSGLQYKIIKDGEGKIPKLADTVKTHYRATYIDGIEFDSSYKTGEPVTFKVDNLIPGLAEALQMMKTGSKWQLYIPAALAYGEEGVDTVVEANKVLLFELELLSIEP